MHAALNRLPRQIPLGLIAAGVALIALGNGAFAPGPASAAAALEIDGSCEPEAVRPNEAALVYCTVSVTNPGTEAATGLYGSVFIADGCNIPSRFSFIDRTLDGILMPPLGLSFELEDIAPGATAVQVSRVATESFSTGPVGGSVTITSRDKPDVSATIDLCWDVSNSAPAPGADLRVTKTLLSEPSDPPGGPDAPPPDSGGPVPILPPSLPLFDEAEYEIVIENVSDVTVSDITLLDVATGPAVLLDASPPATGADSLGRPTWDVGTLAPEGEYRVTVAFGPRDSASCVFSDNIAIASGTPMGGTAQDYIAFADAGVQLGECSQFYPPDVCLHYPADGGEPVSAPCDASVCWAETPDGAQSDIIYDCDEDSGYCYFIGPDTDYTPLQPCDEPVCWIDFGLGQSPPATNVPCTEEFCQHTSPDGSEVTAPCSVAVCWAENPSTGDWQRMFGCGQFGTLNDCWFIAPDGSQATSRHCDSDICWLASHPGDRMSDVPCDMEYCLFTAPDGSNPSTGPCELSPGCWSNSPDGSEWQQAFDCGEDFDWCWFTGPQLLNSAVLFECELPLGAAVNVPDGGIIADPSLTIGTTGTTHWCWMIPPDEGPFYTFVFLCDLAPFFTWVQLEDGTWVSSFGDDFCFFPLPPVAAGLSSREDAGSAIDDPGVCPGDIGPGVPGSSVPAELVALESTPAMLVEGNVEVVSPEPSSEVTPVEYVTGDVTMIDPMPSVDVVPANVVPAERVERIDNPVENPVALPVDPPNDGPPATEPGAVEGDPTSEPRVSGLPNAGAYADSPGTATPATWMAAALLAGILAGGVAFASLRRVGL